MTVATGTPATDELAAIVERLIEEAAEAETASEAAPDDAELAEAAATARRAADEAAEQAVAALEAPSEPAGVDEKQLERALRNHEKAMRKVLGEAFADLTPCETCEGFGFTPPGAATSIELKVDPATEACQTCNGWGDVLTGSRKPGGGTRACPGCSGLGFTTMEQLAGTPQVDYAPPLPGNGQPPAPPAPPVDQNAIEALRRAGYTVFDPAVPAVAASA